MPIINRAAFRLVSRGMVFVLVLAVAVVCPPVCAQTISSAVVLGTVTDPSKAVVPNAQVELRNIETNVTATQNTNNSGQYFFPSVQPGSYRITVKKEGFRTATMPDLKVDVARSYNLNVGLDVGAASEVVEVQATAQVELQTTDAQLGNVISSESMVRLPTLTRQAAELLSLQPGVSTATPGAFPGRGIRVTGAIDDQNAIYLDGIDITENVIGGENSTRTTMFPVSADSVEEFRTGISNPNASFARASGGQVAMVGRRGSNTLHGAVFWYHQNDELNANSWENNRLGIKRAELKDNRFGARVGGRIFKDKTFFFAHYDGRRFAAASNILRLAPSGSLRGGTLQFRDCASGQFDSKGNCIGVGNVVPYALATSTLCGSGATACDPRGIGISPAVSALWGLMPTGNDPTAPNADGLNTIGFRSTVSTPQRDNTGIFRLDHAFSSKWNFNGRYTYSKHAETGTGELDIRNGASKSIIGTPRVGDGVIAGLTGQITPNLLNAFHFGWIRERNTTAAQTPTQSAGILNIPGTSSSLGPIAIAPALALTASAGTVDAPIDVDTQRARFQATYDKNIQFNDDLTWVKGNHTLQFGGDIRKLPTVHVRADKVVGSLTSLVAFMDADVSNFLTSIPAANRPPTCHPANSSGPAVTTNCVRSTDLQSWDRLYAASLGLLDSVGILAVRDGTLNPLPLGTNLTSDDNLKAYYFYGQDTWRLRPSLTLTYGLAYGWQTPPQEKLGRQTLIIDNGTGKLLTAKNYLDAKQQAALAGQALNSKLAYQPVRAAKRDVFNTDWTNLAPRVSAAWNPTGGEGFFSRIFGNRRTVLRGGFGIVYDRSNTVQTVIIPMLGVGFAQTITVATPACNASGTPGAGCNAAGTTPGASLFRVGVDGTMPLPAIPAVSSPVVPTTPFSETLSFQVDPDTKIGRSYNIDFTIQRELPGNMVLEAAYAGRLGRHLPQAVNFNSSPYFFKDSASGQSFAQAFDAVATALRGGQAPLTIATQPWFDNQLPGLAGVTRCPAGSTPTTCMANNFTSAFTNGLVSNLFNSMGGFRTALGLPSYNNRQVLELFMRTYKGESNYHGLLVTLRKRTSRGLTFDANYTFAKALDDAIANQNSAGYFSNSFNTHADYGPSLYDRTHSFVGDFVYELPGGKGHRFSTGKSWIDKVIGGWYTSGIFSTYTGIPLIVVESGQVWGGGVVLSGNTAAIPTATVGTGLHPGVVGSSGVGTSGDPAKKGTGLNLFGDPAAAFNGFRKILLSQDTASGRGRPLRGLGFWNLDMSLGKSTAVTERVHIAYSFDFFNIFNNVNFNNPTLDLRTPANFGVISSQFVPNNRLSGSRWIQFGLRVEF